MQYNIKCVELGLPPDALTAFFFTQEQARSARGEIAIRYYNARGGGRRILRELSGRVCAYRESTK